MPPPNDPLTVLETLQQLENVKKKAGDIAGLMILVEKAACDAIVEVINNYLDATYASLELQTSEIQSLEAHAGLHDMRESIAKLKTGLPPVLA